MLISSPATGSEIMTYRGDVIQFSLTTRQLGEGNAWIRTTLNHGEKNRRDIINHVEFGKPKKNDGWFDFPLKKESKNRYKISLPMLAVGYFQAKVFFLPENSDDPIWPDGDNIYIKIEPADTCCANIVYNAFVRQFISTKEKDAPLSNDEKKSITALAEKGYTVIPPSGTFRDLIQQLDFIFDTLGCRIIQLLPIHPVPTLYGKMGAFGSAFASLDFFDVDPSLAEFDTKHSPFAQFVELVDAVHHKHGKIFLDIATNHTGWASKLQNHHPEWFVREQNTSFFSPGAWGTTWEDLIKLDYNHHELWNYMADMFLSWCRTGVDGFRCDAGYKIPVPVWQYIVAKVRLEFPDTLFLLEGLGGYVHTTRELMTTANINWAYSELFQNYDRNQIEHYLPGALDISEKQGLLINFSETHDNKRLAATSSKFSKLRTALAALTSINGGYGFANGVEWLATEKINVHQSNDLNWGSRTNLISFISKLSNLLKNHSAFNKESVQQMIQRGEGNSLAIVRRNEKMKSKVLVLINLDHDKSNPVKWKTEDVNWNATTVIDLLTETKIKFNKEGIFHTIQLEPGSVLCLENQHEQSKKIIRNSFQSLDNNIQQSLKAKALCIYYSLNNYGNCQERDTDTLVEKLFNDPMDYCRSVNSSKTSQTNVVHWNVPEDANREVMIPPNHFVYVNTNDYFQLQICQEGRVIFSEFSLPQKNKSQFSLVYPIPLPDSHRHATLKLTIFASAKIQRFNGQLLHLTSLNNTRVQRCFSRDEIIKNHLSVLATNGRGAMATVNASWGTLTSKYDALLAGNLNPDYPDDRQIMLTRCRLWVVSRDYSYEINDNLIHQLIHNDDNTMLCEYVVPVGNGQTREICIHLAMMQNRNAIKVTFYCKQSSNKTSSESDQKPPIKLIIRPDLEDRNFHEDTKAYAGPEAAWENAVSPLKDGFTFSPNVSHSLKVTVSESQFHPEPEWEYMIHHSIENERGLNPTSDLFSPGYFSVELKEKTPYTLLASIKTKFENYISPDEITEKSHPKFTAKKEPLSRSLIDSLSIALKQFVVKRTRHKTIIAGYPWFLDWGRDTLICSRGMIAAGYFEETKAILKQFAQFEEHGTIPNMIRGNDIRNRDTSDAPLWLIVAVSDYINTTKSDEILDMDCDGRSLMKILESIINAYSLGTPNGIVMDNNSGLIFSPAHFTWMDTNHPAGTPRQGYPVEIQGLWYAALNFMSKYTGNHQWRNLAGLIKESIKNLYYNKELGYLSDCLHAQPGQAASEATADDALRPNQLFCITLNSISTKKITKNMLAACEKLLIPGAIRSLADQPVNYPQPVIYNEKIINDPVNPYCGHYLGDENTSRKPAYHNGTAWTWVFPSYGEALLKTFGNGIKGKVRSILSSSTEIINKRCINQVPEILDGNFPHHQRGCLAQAWGVSELYRVLKLLN